MYAERLMKAWQWSAKKVLRAPQHPVWDMLTNFGLGAVSSLQLEALPDDYLVCAVCSFRERQRAGSLGVAKLIKGQVHRTGVAPFKRGNRILRSS